MLQPHPDRFLAPASLLPVFLAALAGCSPDELSAPQRNPEVLASIQAGSATILSSDAIDSLPVRRPGAAQVRWGVNINPLQLDPYKRTPATVLVGLVRRFGASAVRFPVDLFADGTSRNDDGSTYAPVPQVLSDLHAAAMAHGMLELPVLLATPTEEITGAASPQAAEDFAVQAVGNFLDARPGWYQVVQSGNEYAGPGRGAVCQTDPNALICERLVAALRGGLRAARSRGLQTVFGDGGDANWFMSRVLNSVAFDDVSFAGWNFYAGSCGFVLENCVELNDSGAAHFRVPSLEKSSFPGTVSGFLNSTGRSQHWYTEFSRDLLDIDNPPMRAVREQGVALQVARVARDLHSHRTGGVFGARAAFAFELFDRIGDTVLRERSRGLLRCGLYASAFECPEPLALKPAGDSLRRVIVATSDSAAFNYAVRAVRFLGRWTSAGSDVLNHARAAGIASGTMGLRQSVDGWLAEDSVRALFVQFAYTRILNRSLDLSIVPNQEALNHWVGCLRGSPTCVDGLPKSREWLLAEIASSDEVWNNAGANRESYAIHLTNLALPGLPTTSAPWISLRARVRSLLIANQPRWRASQEAFWSPEYRGNETSRLFRELFGRGPSTTDSTSAVNPRGESISSTRFQERILSDLVRSRSFIQARLSDLVTPW